MKNILRISWWTALTVTALAVAGITLDWLITVREYPNIGFGNAVTELTGCRELGDAWRFRLYADVCFWILAASPIFFIPAVLENWKQKLRVLLLFAALVFFCHGVANLHVRTHFQYRAELRERFGKDDKGYLAVDRLMPPDIRKEYAEGPRSKNLIVNVFLGWIPWTFWNLLWLTPFLIARWPCRPWQREHSEIS